MLSPSASRVCCNDREVDLHLRLAEDSDLPALVRLRDDAARWMCAQGITGQWQPGQLGEDHFRQAMVDGEVWVAEAEGRVAGAWELWWEDEDAWGPQPPVAGYVHRLMVDRSTRPGTGRYLDLGYRVVGHKAGKPQPGGPPKSFTLMEKAC